MVADIPKIIAFLTFALIVLMYAAIIVLERPGSNPYRAPKDKTRPNRSKGLIPPSTRAMIFKLYSHTKTPKLLGINCRRVIYFCSEFRFTYPFQVCCGNSFGDFSDLPVRVNSVINFYNGGNASS